MRTALKTFAFCSTLLISTNLIAQQASSNLPPEVTKKVKAISADIVKCAVAKAPKGTQKVQVELYPLPDDKGQLISVAFDKNNKPTAVEPCDPSKLASTMSGLFPYMTAEQGKRYAGYLFVSTVDAQNIAARLITEDEYKNALAAASRKK